MEPGRLWDAPPIIMKKKITPNIPCFEPVGHLYHTNDGTCLDSVTTILKAELGLYQFSSQNAANRGTRVHKACQYLDEKDLDRSSLDSEVGPYVDQYEMAIAHHGIKVHKNELCRYSPKYMYAGTIDKIVTIGGENGVLDLKTGSLEKWHKWQVAPYFDMVKDEFAAYGLPLTRRWGLILTPTSYRLVEHTGPRDMLEFLTFLAAHNLKINNGYRKRKAEQN